MESNRLKTDVSGVQITPAASIKKLYFIKNNYILMKNFFFAFFLLSILFYVSAINPKLVGPSELNLTTEWVIDFTKQIPSYLTLKVFAFNDYPFQKVVSLKSNKNFKEERDSFGNKILVFKIVPTSPKEVIELTSVILVNYSFNYEEGSYDNTFVEESTYVKRDFESEKKAIELTENAENDFEKLVRLTEWVHNHISYEGTGYGETVMPSDWVFKKRVGTCDEYSHLLISMLRSVRIPARICAGYVYSGTNWGLHSWVEALVDGRWIPSDPTFNEVGLLDGTHVKFAHGIDQANVLEEFQAPASFNLSTLFSKRNFNISFSYSNFSKLFGVRIDYPTDFVGSKSLEKISVKIVNKENEIAVPVHLLVPKEISIIEGKNFLLHLNPFEEKEVQYIVLFPEMKEQTLYTFPAEISTIGRIFYFEMKGKKNAESRFEERAQILSIDYFTTETNTGVLSVKIKNTGNVDLQAIASLKLYSKELNESVFLRIGEETTVLFNLPNTFEENLFGTISLRLKSSELVQPFKIIMKPTSPNSEKTDFLSPFYLVIAAIAFLILLFSLFYANRRQN